MKGVGYNALVVEDDGAGRFSCSVKRCSTNELPEGDILVRVCYSSLNYKDALSASGNRGVSGRYPHTPGIDAAGVVEESRVGSFRRGEKVMVTGYDLGMNTPGGFAEYIRVPAEWVMKLPGAMSLRESMLYGTAGFTAAMSFDGISALKRPDAGEIVVTGATGGVGVISIALFAKLGYRVVAVTGKPEAEGMLKALGAERVISRFEATDTSTKALLEARWAGVVDTTGGLLLTTALKSMRPQGVATCCGNAASGDLSMTVYPFILRGIRLIGIDSQHCPMEYRRLLWGKLAGEWSCLERVNCFQEIALDEVPAALELMLAGKHSGRFLLHHA